MCAAYLLGIDAGTTVLKCTLFDLEGREIAGAAQDTTNLYPRSGWAEADMEGVWQAVVATVRQTLQRAAVDPASIRALGVTGQGDGTWLVDAAGRPVRPAILWSDNRTADFVRDCYRTGQSAELFRISGTALNTCNQAAHLRWLQIHEPDTVRRTAAVLRAKDWIFLQLTGVVSTDESDASHTYFSVQSRTYDERIFELFGIEAWRGAIPSARPAVENVAELRPALATELGLGANTLVASGPFDVVASALGVGAINPGDACTVLGTAGIHLIVTSEPVVAPENVGYTICHAPHDRLLRLLPTMSGAGNLQWFVREFYKDELAAAEREGANIWDRLEKLAGQAPLGSNGILYHPYIDPAGERAPFVAPDARAQFTGLSMHHRREDMLRAVYEGVVLSALDCYTMMPLEVAALKLAGGGARSPLWAQMLADALGSPVIVVEGSEFGARGAVINAGVAAGLYGSYVEAVEQMIQPARCYEPDPANRAGYARLLALYRATRAAMLPVWSLRADQATV